MPSPPGPVARLTLVQVRFTFRGAECIGDCRRGVPEMKHGNMRNRMAVLTCRISAAIGASFLMALGGLSAHADHRGGGYYVSVEIPIEEHAYPEGASLRLDRLVDRRTGFDSDHFHLRELVLIARAVGAAQAELRVHGEASESINIPEGEEDEWWEVRIPAPTERHGGVWRLYLTGDVALDQIVAVMEPRERYAARYQSPEKTAKRYASTARRYRPDTYYTYYPPRLHSGTVVHYVHNNHYDYYGYRTWYPRYASPWIRRYDPLISFHYYTVLPGWRHDHGVRRHVLGGHHHHTYRQRPLRRFDPAPRLATRSGRPAPLSQPTGRASAPLDASLRTYSRGPETRTPAPRRRANEPRVQPERMAAARDRLETHAQQMTAPSRPSATAPRQRAGIAQRPAVKPPRATQTRPNRATTSRATQTRQQPRPTAATRPNPSPSAAPSLRSRLADAPRRSAPARSVREQRPTRRAAQTRPSRTQTWHGTPQNRGVANSRSQRSADRLRTVRQQPSMRSSAPQRQATTRTPRPQSRMRSFEPRPQMNRPAPRTSAPRQSAPRMSVPRQPAPRMSAPRQPAPRMSAPRQPAPRMSAPRQSAPRMSAPRQPAPRVSNGTGRLRAANERLRESRR